MFEFDLIAFFSQYAYEPWQVYGFICVFMTASSFGLPIPEELTLISAGLVAYMARNPDLFPPPTPDAVGVNLTVLSIVCFVAVLGSDFIIYFLGRFFGNKILASSKFQNKLGGESFKKVEKWFDRYGSFAIGIFRFTPGIRFPGHLTCGAMKVPFWKFLTIDGFAALISVPTQVVIVALYGEVILARLKEFKIIIGSIIVAVIVIYFIRRIILNMRKKSLSKD